VAARREGYCFGVTDEILRAVSSASALTSLLMPRGCCGSLAQGPVVGTHGVAASHTLLCLSLCGTTSNSMSYQMWPGCARLQHQMPAVVRTRVRAGGKNAMGVSTGFQ
jgi:hypothetical protein